jgi:hypothetical protein
MLVACRVAIEECSVQLPRQRRFILRFEPLKELTAVDCKNTGMSPVTVKLKVLERSEELVEQFIRRLTLPRGGAVDVDMEHAAICKSALKDPMR